MANPCIPRVNICTFPATAADVIVCTSDADCPGNEVAEVEVVATAPYIYGNGPPYSHNHLDTLPFYQLTTETDVAALLGAIAVTSVGALVALFTQTVVASERSGSDFAKTFFELKILVQHAIKQYARQA